MEGQTPFEILKQELSSAGSASEFVRTTGIRELAMSLEAIGFMCAVIVILLAMMTLMFVNYPKTVAQTKQRIVQALLSVLFIAILPLFLDVVYTACRQAFYGG